MRCPNCPNPGGCPKCERVCHDPRCLSPDHHHPEPSAAQRTVFSLPWPDMALWCADMGARALRGGDRQLAGTCVMTALHAACRGDRTDPALVQLVAELNPVALDLLSGRYAVAQSGLDSIVSARAKRAAEIDAALDVAGMNLMRLDREAV